MPGLLAASAAMRLRYADICDYAIGFNCNFYPRGEGLIFPTLNNWRREIPIQPRKQRLVPLELDLAAHQRVADVDLPHEDLGPGDRCRGHGQVARFRCLFPQCGDAMVDAHA